MKTLILYGFISILLLATIVSCGNSTSPVDPVVSDGAWAGTLSLSGESITFTVGSNQVRNLQVTFVYWGSALPADTIIWTPDDAMISDNKFHMTDTLSNGHYSYSMSINGTFDPPSNVSGMFGTTGLYDSLGTHHSTSDSCSWSGNHN
ncbi:MAG: hypothetical protein GQ565_00065 [Candidatus Aegiribacteria sp.]|nr:hypothetical protein [Candidatus Aegiribacteria sp.]